MHNSNNTTNSTYDDIYSAVISLEPLRELQTQRQMAANPQTKPNYLGCESASRPLPSTSTVLILLLLSPKAGDSF